MGYLNVGPSRASREAKGPTVNGRKCRALVQAKQPFKGYGSIYARACGPKGYAVFSYGEHWPLHVWDGEQWFHNPEPCSVTTSKHYSQSHPWDTNRTAASILSCQGARDLVAKLDRGES